MSTTRHTIALALLASALPFGAGCSGVGGITVESAPTTVSFVNTGFSVVEGGSVQLAVTLVTTLEATESEVTVDVVDLISGTATAGSDYVAMGRTTVTFPAGSEDGDVQLVSFQSLVDSSAEGADETALLALENASGAALVGITESTVTIGDLQTASVQFTQTSTVTPDESSMTHSVEIELDLSPGATLGFDIDLSASDDGTGSATSGTDFAPFTVMPVTFASGTPDGTTVTASVQVIDDTYVEGPEFLALVLGGASAGDLDGSGTVRHVFTITDDETSPDPAFSATSGLTGTETTHTSGDTIDLGSQLNGGGPNLGLQLVVGNQGGSNMSLGAPVLSGANATDFLVEVEQASTGGTIASGMTVDGETVDLATPFRRRAEVAKTGAPGASTEESGAVPKPGLSLEIDEAELALLSDARTARLHGVPMPGTGDVTLRLERQPLPFTDDSVLLVDGEIVAGGPRVLVSDLSLWAGSAMELPGSRVFLALSSEGARGTIELDATEGRTIHLSTEKAATAEGPATLRMVREADLAALPGADRDALALCGGQRLVPGRTFDPTLPPQETVAPPDTSAPPVSALVTPADCRLAIETDYQLFQKIGSSSGVTDYVASLVGAVSDQYLTDVQTTLSIAYLGIYTTASDPWTTPDGPGTTTQMLDEFRNAWVTNGWPVAADLAHFLAGAELGGGLAYVDVLCDQLYGFGVSGGIDGNIDWNTWTGSAGSFTWDFVVFAHELGHNFGASHTHDYCPPIDICASNCQGSTACSQGTIMSYCHGCGGMDNIDLRFHGQIANIMRQNVESSCLGDATLEPGDTVRYRLRFRPLSGIGAKSATLRFDHDAPNAADPFELLLTGSSN